MNLKIFDFYCGMCGTTHDALVESNVDYHECPECSRRAQEPYAISTSPILARKVIGIPGAHCSNEDAPWIRSIRDVVDKDSRKPHNVEFLQRPTRTNLKRWMAQEGVRWFEPGEKPEKPKVMSEAERIHKTYERYQKRTALEI